MGVVGKFQRFYTQWAEQPASDWSGLALQLLFPNKVMRSFRIAKATHARVKKLALPLWLLQTNAAHNACWKYLPFCPY